MPRLILAMHLGQSIQMLCFVILRVPFSRPHYLPVALGHSTVTESRTESQA